MTRFPFELSLFSEIVGESNLLHLNGGEHRFVVKMCHRVLIPPHLVYIKFHWHSISLPETFALHTIKIFPKTRHL